MRPFFILDNGGATIKAGFAHKIETKVIPNCITKVKSERRRFFIGDQIDECSDLSGLYYTLPIQKGYIVNWDVQKSVWDYLFNCDNTKVNFSETNFIITEPYFNFRSSRQPLLEIFFEDYEARSLFLVSPSDLSYFNFIQALKSRKYCTTLIIDSGYSFTHIIPYVNGCRVNQSIKRIDVGGKLLTNHLKEIISYRQLNVMDETYVMNQVKEDTLFVSMDFKDDLNKAKDKNKRHEIMCDYVLPDFSKISRGYILPTDAENRKEIIDNHQMIRLNHERFTVPEILFHPSDIGLNQKGLAQAAVSCIESCQDANPATFVENIILTGGNCLFSNFSGRFFNEIRSWTPDFWDVNVFLPKDPISFAFDGGVSLAKQYPEYVGRHSISKRDYDECGPNAFLEPKSHRMWSNFN